MQWDFGMDGIKWVFTLGFVVVRCEMRIWVDADACPVVVREIIFRAAQRVGVETVLVANQPVAAPRSKWVRAIQVPQGFDKADNEILKRIGNGDLLVTGDIPLAASAVGQGALVLNPRGERYTPENIGERLATRDLMEQLRSTGTVSGGPAPLDKRDRQAFANALDRILSVWQRRRDPG
jgi:uncharacterized protein